MVLRTASGSNVPGRFGARAIYGSSGGGGPGADPTLPAFSSVAAQWSADQITPQSDNTAVTSWTERVTGIPLVQATGVNQPKYRTARVGGKPSVQTVGSTWLSGLIPSLKTIVDTRNYTVMCVVANVVTQGNGTVFGNAAGSNSFCFMATGTATGRFDGGTVGAVNCLTLAPDTNPAFRCFGSSSYNFKVYAGQTNSALERVYMEGGCVNSNVVACPATSSADGKFTIGATNSIGQLSGKQDILEVIVWNRALTALEWIQAEIWACSKYTQALPWTALGKMYVYDGDSITVGVGSPSLSNSYPYLIHQSLALSYGQWTMQAVGGLNWADCYGKTAEWTGIAAQIGLPLKVAAFEWYNEQAGGSTAAQIYSHAQTYVSTVKATANIKVGLASSTSYSLDSGIGSNRDLYNGLLDVNNAFADGYANIHVDTNIGIIGPPSAYATNNATLWADGVHINAAGRIFLAPRMQTMITAL